LKRIKKRKKKLLLEEEREKLLFDAASSFEADEEEMDAEFRQKLDTARRASAAQKDKKR